MRTFPSYIFFYRKVSKACSFWALWLLPVVCSSQDQAYDWQVFLLGEPKLAITLPAKVVPMEVQVPFDMINHIKRFDTYRLYFAEGKVVAVFKFAEYNIPIAASPRDVLKDELSKILTGLKAANIQQDEDHIKFQGMRGFKAEGSFEINQTSWLFEDHVFVRDGAMWQVWIGVEEGEEVHKEILKKMVKSLKFKL